MSEEGRLGSITPEEIRAERDRINRAWARWEKRRGTIEEAEFLNQRRCPHPRLFRYEHGWIRTTSEHCPDCGWGRDV